MGRGIRLKLECRGMRISRVFWRSGRNGTLSLEQSATREWLDMNLEKAADFKCYVVSKMFYEQMSVFNTSSLV